MLKKLVTMESQSKIVFVLGGPGAGKGTACTRIAQKYGFSHLSAGDLLREELRRPNSEYREIIDRHIRNGKIVPVEITCSLLEKAMQESKNQKFLIDGFPRNLDNLEGWNRNLASKVNLLFVLYLDCSEEICVQRCLKRGSEGSGRSDDNIESLKKRMNIFMKETKPIIDYYENLHLVRKLNAHGTPQEVFQEIAEIFDQIPSEMKTRKNTPRRVYIFSNV